MGTLISEAVRGGGHRSSRSSRSSSSSSSVVDPSQNLKTKRTATSEVTSRWGMEQKHSPMALARSRW